jgi:hypothetical protein
MSRILTITFAALMLAGCAGTYNKVDTYDKSVMPTAAAGLQRETVGCKARWTAKEFKTYSEWQACQLTVERGFARTITLTKMDAFEVYAADMQALAADRDAKRVTDRQVRSRANEILDTFLADCGCKPRSYPFAHADYFNPVPNPIAVGFSAGGSPAQHTPLP